MSLAAMRWALRDAPITGRSATTDRCVLVALADYFNDRTQVCWPSISTLACDLAVSESTIKRSLRRLEAAGLITRGDPRFVAHLETYRRPTVWTLVMTTRRDTPVQGHDITGQVC